jgi:ribosomal protein L29
LTEELGANLAGAEIALKLMGKIDELERETNQLRQELARLRSSLETRKTETRKT